MAIEIERLIATLEANFNTYDRALKKALGSTHATFAKIETRGKQMESRIAAIGGNIGRNLVGALAAGISVQAFKQLSDAATRIDNALKVAGLSGAELDAVYGRLRDSAMRNAAPLEALVSLYGRAAVVQKELGVSGEELLSFTDNIAVALRVSGKSATESAGALLQLSQALGAGTVRAEEFNSVQEGALPIAQAAARGLKEAGGSVAKLKQLVIDGKVSSEAFFRAFEAGAPSLADAVADAQITTDQALGNLKTALIDSVREFNNATGASERFAGGIDSIARSIASVDVGGFIQKIKDAYGETDRFLDGLANSGLIERFAEMVTGLDLTVGQPIDFNVVEAQNKLASLDREVEALREHIKFEASMNVNTAEARANLAGLIRQADQLRASLASPTYRAPAGTPGDYNSLASAPVSVPKKVTPVSIKDYAVTGTKKGGAKSKVSDYEREIEQITRRTAALTAETAALASVNPLIEDYGYAVEKARAVHELLTAAQESGVEITPQLRAQIDQLATAYAQASVDAERLAESQNVTVEAAKEFADLGKDVLGGFIQDLRNGVDASEALAKALDKLADKALDLALNAIFGGGKGGGLLGGLGALLGIPGFAEGTNSAPGGLAWVGERGPELMNVPKGAQIFPSDVSRKIASAGGGGTQKLDVAVTVGWSRNADGNLKPFVESVSNRMAVAVIGQAAPGLVSGSVSSTQAAMRNRPGFVR